MKLHLVDGTYELFRAYYGAPPATSPTGQEVGATRGLLRTLLALLRGEEVTHVGVAFDHVIESFRNDLFSGYKTSDGVEPALMTQFGLAERATAALGVVVWPMVEFEADDALATAADRFGGDTALEQIILCSPDKDLAQCVRATRVVCLDRRRQVVLDRDGVVAKFGVEPESIPDYLALVGDAADGIPGIPRWGAKSVARVLARYRHLEAIPADAADWEVTVRGATALAQSLRDHADRARLYRTLATLRRDVPLGEGLADLQWRGARRSELEALAAEIGDQNVISLVSRWQT